MRGARYLRGWAGLNSPCLHSPAHGLALAAPDPDSSAPRVVALGGEGRQTGLVMETGDSGGSLVGCAQTCCDVVGDIETDGFIIGHGGLPSQLYVCVNRGGGRARDQGQTDPSPSKGEDGEAQPSPVRVQSEP